MVGKVRERGETGSTDGMTTPLTWIAELSGLLQSSIISTTIHTAVEQLDYTGTATVNTVASTIYTMNCTP